jgi:2-iminobutanoate/2-iminopropanoate deaminase
VSAPDPAPEPRAVVSPEVAEQPLPFSPAIVSGGFVFVSGQASVDDRGAIVLGSFEEEMRRSIENLDRVLRAADCGLGDVVQVRAYVHDAEHLDQFNRIYRDYFSPPLPARTTLTNCLGPVKFEIDAVARHD